MTKKTERIILILILLFLPLSIFSETLDHTALMDKTGARLLWDPVLKKGILLKNGRSIVFLADEPILLLNGKDVVHTAAILYEKGNLKFSSDTVNLISKFFLNKGSAAQESSFRVSAIILDPGHGGRDSGATSRFPVDGINVALQEKNLVLDLTLALKERLEEKFRDKEIILTRENDIYPTLEDRVELANGVNTENGEGIIYISIHGNASLNTKAEGFEVWYLPEDYRRQIIPEKESENGSIDPVLNTLMEEEFTLESKKLAGYILNNLEKEIGGSASNRGLKEESWFVVRNAMMASVLVEAGFITNNEESMKLRDPRYLIQINNGIYNGIVDFVDFFENRFNE
ncbi:MULTISPECIES: N-acetylmuramoyl-L-alanine amidase [unclassified Oceanispirochaeta]|uniref:N-acetylmuramoyl-L-alanine amidase family protein n=1 Tax=unclassified Oceanispirochaeta TaxID=2635722 RepID=UPI000E094737|nr:MULTISPECIES: N-acetylmuramoyl-L-alanine amidase [unclassified Oceanispirochaeta]MBF9017661.1 N-acetylmuramoyl-L-alanine amidase [Oceanispirochaeta sp. M2]NPD74233.1 N-acetylmuramoyl-L-alanine amidase [Oceanispirochaeta sp. M1]RDG29939.1 N-acetylmuramoyl-L-alanine amidase [Oceanispirochaeta sp. M1]